MLTRIAAFSLFAWAAFDWPTYALDRAGVAALGAAFATWSVSAGVSRAWRPPTDPVAASEDELAFLPDSPIADVLERLGAYGVAGGDEAATGRGDRQASFSGT